MSDPTTRQVTVPNRLGLHARPAMEFVDLASSFASDVRVRRTDSSDDHVDGKSIMQMMMLAATKGTVLEIVCTGDDADHAANTLAELIETGFHEE